jgi:hypothetical protein
MNCDIAALRCMVVYVVNCPPAELFSLICMQQAAAVEVEVESCVGQTENRSALKSLLGSRKRHPFGKL